MKKITKILDSVMRGLKRTCVAKAIAVVAVATIAMNSFAQEVETITGVKDLAGKDITYINSHLTTDGKYPVDMDKKFFLYNEATGKFLNIGSYWGTHVALADYGKPLWVVSGTREICTNPDAYYLNREIQTNNVLLFTHNMATTLSEDQGSTLVGLGLIRIILLKTEAFFLIEKTQQQTSTVGSLSLQATI